MLATPQHAFTRSDNPRAHGRCACGASEAEHPDRSTPPVRDPDFEAEFLDDLLKFAAKLGGIRTGSYRPAVRGRLTIGAERYGDSTFFTRDNVQELLEETPDIAAYCVLELQKVRARFGEDSEEYLQRRHILLGCAAFAALSDDMAREYARVDAGLE